MKTRLTMTFEMDLPPDGLLDSSVTTYQSLVRTFFSMHSFAVDPEVRLSVYTIEDPTPPSHEEREDLVSLMALLEEIPDAAWPRVLVRLQQLMQIPSVSLKDLMTSSFRETSAPSGSPPSDSSDGSEGLNSSSAPTETSGWTPKSSGAT